MFDSVLNKCLPGYFNSFVRQAPFLYPLKTSENGKVFWCFQGGREKVR